MANDALTLRRWFEQAPYPARLGARLEQVEPDRVRFRIPYKDENSNPGRALHGGVAASAIDLAGVCAAWTGLGDPAALETGTLDLSVDYLAAAIGEDIVVDGSVLRRGKEIVYAEVDVRNEAGKRIAKGLVTHRAAPAASPEAAARQRVTRMAVPADAGRVPELARALTAVPFIARLGLVIEHMDGGDSRIRLPDLPENADADGALHEGAIAALVDTTGAMAAWSLVGLDFRHKASTVGLHVSFHGRARGGPVVALGRTLRWNNEIFLNEVRVYGVNDGQQVATGAVTYRIVQQGT